MTKFIALISLVVLFACSVRSQSSAPSPTPAPSPRDSDVVKITTTLIQIDVTVKDRDGKTVRDLRPDEIKIYENGEEQEVSNFSFVSNARSGEEVAKPPASKDNVPLPPSALKAANVRRTIALVVDDLTLSFESTYQVRRALKKFVDEQMQDGDLVAIIRTGAGIGALQQFTNDKRQLYAAIERVRWNASGAGGIGAFAPIEEITPLEPDQEDTPPGPDQMSKEEFAQEFDDFRESFFATGTLGAINYVIRGMQELPGRKSVLLLSDGFKLFVQENGWRTSSRIIQRLYNLIDLANRASVVIYTMDARGLQLMGLTAADDPAGRTPRQLAQTLSDRSAQLLDTQEGLNYLAQQTGGISIVNSNDLSGGIRKILDEQSYYLVAYEPKGTPFDARTRQFNRIEVKVTRPGTVVRYRSGFFAGSDQNLVKLTPAKTVEQRMYDSLASPFAVNDIPLRLNALFYKPLRHATTYVRSLVYVPAKDLTFTEEPGGGRKAVFDVVAAGFGDNGTIVEQLSKTYSIILTKDGHARAIKQGLVYEFTFPLKPGVYQLRVALHDQGSDKIGSANQFIEVPNLKKKRLVLSGFVLENMPYEEWQRRDAGHPVRTDQSDPLVSTSLRTFRRGTVLSYGFNIYNAKIVGSAPNLTFQTRLFRDGKQVFETKQQPVNGVIDSGAVTFAAALALATGMVPGDYVLQVVVTDKGDKSKRNSAMQFVQFEVIE